jgi:hypothetical protein
LTSIFCPANFIRRVPPRTARALSFAQHARRIPAQIDHRAWLDPARPGVDDQVHLVLEPGAHRFGFRERTWLAREQQRGRQHRLVELCEQRVRHRMRRHAHADRLLARQAPRHFPARAQNEGVAARRSAFHQLELRVIDDGVLGHLRKVTAHQRQVVSLVDRPDTAQALEPFRVRAIAAKRVAGIGWIGDDAAVAHDVRRLADEPLLRMGRVDGEKLGHQRARNSSTRRATASG